MAATAFLDLVGEQSIDDHLYSLFPELNDHAGLDYTDYGAPANATATTQPFKPDIALISPAEVLIWINGTQPACYNYTNAYGPCAVPDSVFPFGRLASITDTDKSAVFLYHQLNGTIIVEEQWVQAESRWIAPTYITVKD